jgi:RNA polymerase sigma-70 factor (ECF subfamily)
VTDSGVELGRGASAEEPSSIGSSLLERLKLNDSEAWRRLVHLFGPLVYQWCRRCGLQAADATDVGQEVFRTVASWIGRFRRDRPADTFRGWLWTITRSKIVDHWRRQQKEPQAAGGSTAQIRLAELAAAEPGEVPACDPQTQSSLYQRGLQLIQDEFAEQTWKAFWRVAVDGCPPAEAAKEMDLSINAVYLAKSRVLRRLREELGDLLD